MVSHTGFKGTFVIPWSQSELDGLRAAPVADVRPGAVWRWFGETVRVDGPKGILPLGPSVGEADLRKRVALIARRRFAEAGCFPVGPEPLPEPLFRQSFVVTNGRDAWDVTVIGDAGGRLLMFNDDLPPRATDLWVVRHTLDRPACADPPDPPPGVICFTPGTMILTPDGLVDVAALAEGDLVQTQDNGPARIVWLGRRHVNGARLIATPDLRPVRLRQGALDRLVPDKGLLVSPDHRIVLRGPRARALFNSDEVLVTARDLVNDRTILRDRSVRQVTYIHLMLPRHDIVFANGVATESFHPISAAHGSLDPGEQQRLFDRMPHLQGNAGAYGPFARRPLTQPEAAILRYDLAGSRRCGASRTGRARS